MSTLSKHQQARSSSKTTKKKQCYTLLRKYTAQNAETSLNSPVWESPPNAQPLQIHGQIAWKSAETVRRKKLLPPGNQAKSPHFMWCTSQQRPALHRNQSTDLLPAFLSRLSSALRSLNKLLQIIEVPTNNR